jgi:hypothetical protein
MKTDRELLELAARAAGIEIVEWSCIEESCDAIARLEDMRLHKWNPLTDDGDALRLAVKLNMQIVITGKSDSLDVGITDARSTESGWEKAIHIKCPYDATRRAIVRAAAAIGETL